MPKFDNPFTRKKREAEAKAKQEAEAALKAQNERAKQFQQIQQQVANGRALQRLPSVRPTSVLENLTLTQDLLQRLRALPPNDLSAFPVINESQRLSEWAGLVLEGITPRTLAQAKPGQHSRLLACPLLAPIPVRRLLSAMQSSNCGRRCGPCPQASRRYGTCG